MPELPEVERAVRALRDAIQEAVIERVEVLHPSLRRRVSTAALGALRGTRVSMVERRGKHQLIHLEDGRVEVSEESRPAVLEVLCDECESALKFEEFEDTLRKEVLLTIGAR